MRLEGIFVSFKLILFSVSNDFFVTRKANPEGQWKDWVFAAFNEKVKSYAYKRFNIDFYPILLFSQVNLSAVGYYGTNPIDFDIVAQKGKQFHYFTFGAGVVEVEVDCGIGRSTFRFIKPELIC